MKKISQKMTVKQKNRIIYFILAGFLISIIYLNFSQRSNKKEIKEIYNKIENQKLNQYRQDSIFTDSLVKIRDENYRYILFKIKEIETRQKEVFKKIDKKYEDKIIYISNAVPDTTRSVFGRNFSKSPY